MIEHKSPLLSIVRLQVPRDTSLELDVSCMSCGYNLRGLAINGRCPECAKPVIDSVRDAERAGESIESHLYRQIMQPVAEKAGYTVDAVMFVADAMKKVAQRAAATRGPRSHVNAREVCDGLRELAMSYFNDADEARELLAEWGIRRSEDVGAIVFALVASGHGAKSDADQQSDFDGLFTLDTLLDP